MENEIDSNNCKDAVKIECWIQRSKKGFLYLTASVFHSYYLSSMFYFIIKHNYIYNLSQSSNKLKHQS